MSWIDWAIVAVFMAGLIGMGLRLSAQSEDAQGFFLSNRSVPWWAVSFSLVGTALSAGTFVGVPQLGYTSDLSYLMLLIGSTIGALLAAVLVIPILYRADTLTIYGYLGKRFGPRTEIASAWLFLIGLLLAAGARHFIASIVISLVLFGSYATAYLIVSIILLGVVATLYTMAGGIRAVIWTDVLQVIILAGTALVCLGVLYNALPMGLDGILAILRQAPDGDKLRVWNLELRFDVPYTIWAAIGANALINLAQYGCDQDMVQRTLTCKSAWRASASIVVSRLIQVPIVSLFLVIGLLLYVFHLHTPDPVSGLPPEFTRDSGGVFIFYILEHLPPGVVGLAIAGLLAASMSSFDSASNAMASAAYSNLRRRQEVMEESEPARMARELVQSRLAVLWMGGALTLFAVLAVFIQQWGGERLIDFALGVMTFSYAGLFGVFMTAVLTKRGNERSAVLALWAGALTILAVQPYVLRPLSQLFLKEPLQLAWPWWMVLGGTVALVVCLLGKKEEARQ